jgi:predicted transcriptional regulator
MTEASSPRRRWTHLEDGLLQEMLRAKLTADEIARRLARTPAAVYSRVQYLDKKHSRPVVA